MEWADVKPGEVMAGDLGVVKGKSPRTKQEGQHVGFLTGERRYNATTKQWEFKMLGGNQGFGADLPQADRGKEGVLKSGSPNRNYI